MNILRELAFAQKMLDCKTLEKAYYNNEPLHKGTFFNDYITIQFFFVKLNRIFREKPSNVTKLIIILLHYL